MARRAAELSEPVPRVPWLELRDSFTREWGFPSGVPTAEHVAVLGPTGQGKTLLIAELVSARARARESHVVFIATKPGDATLARLGWPVIRAWPPGYGQAQVVFWPRAGKPSSGAGPQKMAIRRLLDDLWVPSSNRIVVFDEIATIENDLGLRRQVARYWREARSVGITIVAGTQRPRAVSRHMFSEPSWVFLFRFTDQDEARRAGEVGGNRRRIAAAVGELRPHEFLAIHTRTGELAISRVG
jgi:hypothetical protein